MTLYKPTLHSVIDVAERMRAIDRDEIYPLLFDKSPQELARRVLADSRYCWLAATDKPVAVFGAHQTRPGAWRAFAFATDDFPKVYREVTKFLVQRVRSHLFLELGAQRVEAHSSASHTAAHNWLTRLGAVGTWDPEYGPNGETYQHFIMRRSDFDVTQRAKARRIVVSGHDLNQAENRTSPGRQAPSHSAEHVHPEHSQR